MSGRRVNPLEAQWAITGDYAAVNAVGTATVEGPLSAELLRGALDALQARHEVLRVGLRRVRAGHELVPGGGEPIALRLAGGVELADVIEEEAAAPFPPEAAPLLRVTAILRPGGAELIFTFHHAITDMIGGFTMVRDVLEACRQLASGQAADLGAPLPLPHAPPETFPPRARGLRGRLRAVWHVLETRLVSARRKPALLARPSAAPLAERRTRGVGRALSIADTAALERRCREEETSVHGVLVAALLLAAAGKRPPDQPVVLWCEHIASVRRLLEPKVSNEQSGCFVSNLGTCHSVSSGDDLWQLARAVSAEVSRQVWSGAGFLRALAVEKLARPRLERGQHVLGALACSYSGRVRIPWQYGPFRIVDLDGMVSIHGLGPNCFALAIQGPAGLRVRLCFVEPDLNRATVEKLADRTLAALTGAIARPAARAA